MLDNIVMMKAYHFLGLFSLIAMIKMAFDQIPIFF